MGSAVVGGFEGFDSIHAHLKLPGAIATRTHAPGFVVSGRTPCVGGSAPSVVPGRATLGPIRSGSHHGK